MKKILALTLVAALGLSMVACGGKEVTETTESSVVSTETVTTETVSTEATSTEGTIGETLVEAFKAYAEANPDATADEVVAELSKSLDAYFGPMVMPVEEGMLTGFDNAEIKGFEEGVTFAPMIGTIPFVGYVFTLAADADADAFVTTLTDNANPRWNVCTEAEQVLSETVGNKVFFVMCPASFE